MSSIDVEKLIIKQLKKRGFSPRDFNADLAVEIYIDYVQKYSKKKVGDQTISNIGSYLFYDYFKFDDFSDFDLKIIISMENADSLAWYAKEYGKDSVDYQKTKRRVLAALDASVERVR
jgi:hypothetical protein